MERQLGHLVRLIDELLDIARINTGKLELRKESAALREVIENALQVSGPFIAGSGHSLDVQVAPEPCHVQVDRVRIEQVLTNLLSNAAKYTPAGGHIRVSAQAEGGQAVIRIADDGIGIDAATLPALFEVFSQAESARPMRRGGIGIGLSLARRLVTLHGGTLTASSEGANRGSTFTICLPVCAAPAAAPEQTAQPGSAAGLAEARRILVVEDNLDIARTFATLLASLGHHVELAHTGESAIRRAHMFRPEIVFLDLGLPDMSGFDVAGAFRRDDTVCGALLIAVTGWGGDKDRAATRDAGFDMHLTKPVGIEAIRGVLAGVALPEAAAAGA
jgi:CheY-like chemotaxis protein/two-component sensor histidine kinase